MSHSMSTTLGVTRNSHVPPLFLLEAIGLGIEYDGNAVTCSGVTLGEAVGRLLGTEYVGLGGDVGPSIDRDPAAEAATERSREVDGAGDTGLMSLLFRNPSLPDITALSSTVSGRGIFFSSFVDRTIAEELWAFDVVLTIWTRSTGGTGGGMAMSGAGGLELAAGLDDGCPCVV